MNEQAFEVIMEAVCDVCHCCYVLSQEALDAVCENCFAEWVSGLEIKINNK